VPRDTAKERVRAREIYRENLPRSLWKAAQKRARKAGLEFTITVEDVVIPARCPIFDVPFQAPGDGVFTASLDRRHNGQGYTPANTRVISTAANKWKSALGIDTARRFLAYMEDHDAG